MQSLNDSYITLSNLLTQVKNVIDRDFFNKEYLVLAEIGNISKPPNGKHWYFDLIEKDENDKIILIKGNLWEENKNRILSQFEKLNLELKSQIKTIFKVNVNFSLQYGLRLNILDVDAVYVLGDLTKRKLETIEKLKVEKLYSLNKEILFPILPKRIAVISSDNSSGYKDFKETLKNNTYNFCFEIKLFPSLMQGKESIESILRSLRSIYQQKDNFDVVVITRGGGSKTDLELFNDFILCNAICRMNLPVITGLGHTPDESVLDMISNQQRNTPTDAAKFLIDKYLLLLNQLNSSSNKIRKETENLLNENKKTLKNYSTSYYIKTQQLLYNIKISLIHYKEMLSEVRSIVESKRSYLKSLNHKFNLNCSNYTNKLKNIVEMLRFEISNSSKSYLVKEQGRLINFLNVLKKIPLQKIESERNELRNEVKLIQTHWNHYISTKSNQITIYDKSLKQLDPINVLRRGYSITLQNGKPLTDSKELGLNTEITTTLHNGEITSIVKTKK